MELSRLLQASLNSKTTCEDVARLLAGNMAIDRRVNLGGSGRWRQVIVTRDGKTVILEYDRHDNLLAYGIGYSQQADVDLPSDLAMTFVRDAENGGEGP